MFGTTFKSILRMSALDSRSFRYHSNMLRLYVANDHTFELFCSLKFSRANAPLAKDDVFRSDAPSLPVIVISMNGRVRWYHKTYIIRFCQ